MLSRNIKKTLVFIVVTGLISASLLLMTGCGGRGSQDAAEEEKASPKKPAVESLEFQKNGTDGTDTEIEQGVRKLVAVEAQPADADVENLKWSSSDEAIVVLEDINQKSATAFAKAVGEADIICEAPGGAKAVLHVKVKAIPVSDDTAAHTYGGKNTDEGVGDTSIYDPIESFDVKTPDINPVTPNTP